MNIFRSLPKDIVIAVSGGSDSMACLHYFLDKGSNITVAHYVHSGHEKAEGEYEFVKNACKELEVKCVVNFQPAKDVKQSNEEFWRNGRHAFLKSFDCPVVMGHTLDDVVEWYLYSAINGNAKIMKYNNRNIVRPFILQRKDSLVELLENKNVKWFEDITNQNENFAKRNKVRHSLLPKALEVNPGLFNMVKRMVVKDNN